MVYFKTYKLTTSNGSYSGWSWYYSSWTTLEDNPIGYFIIQSAGGYNIPCDIIFNSSFTQFAGISTVSREFGVRITYEKQLS